MRTKALRSFKASVFGSPGCSVPGNSIDRSPRTSREPNHVKVVIGICITVSFAVAKDGFESTSCHGRGQNKKLHRDQIEYRSVPDSIAIFMPRSPPLIASLPGLKLPCLSGCHTVARLARVARRLSVRMTLNILRNL